MSSKTLVAFAAVIIACIGATTLSSHPASAYDGDYERYCYYHRYDPACWRYWHPYGGGYGHYDEHHHHHHDYDRDHDHDHHEHDHDHDHDHDNDHHDHDH